MLMLLLTTIIPLALMLAFGFFVTVTLHEIGHALPALWLTHEEITIFIGSYGEPAKSIRRRFGRLTFYCRYNPLLWYKGCCVVPDYEFSLNEEILFVLGGPLLSLLITIGSWELISLFEQAGIIRIGFGIIFFISLIITASTVIPNRTVRYTAQGYRVYNDGYQLFKLLQAKFSR